MSDELFGGYYVKLTYFKGNGKFYSTGSYVSRKVGLWQIWDEVAEMQRVGGLPGLVSGAYMPIILIKVPQHPHRHPHLVVNMELES